MSAPDATRQERVAFLRAADLICMHYMGHQWHDDGGTERRTVEEIVALLRKWAWPVCPHCFNVIEEPRRT